MTRPATARNAGLATWVAPVLVVVGIALLAWLERRRPLRAATRPRGPRLMRNLGIATGGALVVAAVEAPLARAGIAFAQRRGWGLVPALGLPAKAQPLVALLLLDYTLYLWHVLMHRVPALWRWHLVHHADADLDVSTGLRFYAVEMLCSAPYRLLQVVLLGVPRDTLALWSRLTLAEVLFHHANLRLPVPVERALSRVVVTPRLHGIHHSDRLAHQHANLSSGLAIWDVLHGTRRDDVPQHTITIGLPVEDPPMNVDQRTGSM